MPRNEVCPVVNVSRGKHHGQRQRKVQVVAYAELRERGDLLVKILVPRVEVHYNENKRSALGKLERLCQVHNPNVRAERSGMHKLIRNIINLCYFVERDVIGYSRSGHVLAYHRRGKIGNTFAVGRMGNVVISYFSVCFGRDGDGRRGERHDDDKNRGEDSARRNGNYFADKTTHCRRP